MDGLIFLGKRDELVGIDDSCLFERKPHQGFGCIIFSGLDIEYGLAVGHYSLIKKIPL